MSYPLIRGARRSLLRFFAEARRRSLPDEVVIGHHNVNVIVALGQPLALLLGMPSGRIRANFRTPFTTLEVAPRIWRHESEVLRAVGDHAGDVPTCLMECEDWALHRYLPGQTLSEVAPRGPVGGARIAQLAQFFACLADIPRGVLPPLPADWPDDGDTYGFVRRLARFTEEKVHWPNRARFGTLFDAVGIPRDGVERFMRSVTMVHERPFSLLHTDVHRANVVVVQACNGERLSVIDWELALYGDPLHDLATHLVRMDYDIVEWELAVQRWADAMKHGGHADMTAGMDDDLPVYVGFEHAQSVFPDVMRAALALPAQPSRGDFARAAAQVRRALLRAREPMSLVEIPGEGAVTEALRQWSLTDTRWRRERVGDAWSSGQPERLHWTGDSEYGGRPEEQMERYGW